MSANAQGDFHGLIEVFKEATRVAHSYNVASSALLFGSQAQSGSSTYFVSKVGRRAGSFFCLNSLWAALFKADGYTFATQWDI